MRWERAPAVGWCISLISNRWRQTFIKDITVVVNRVKMPSDSKWLDRFISLESHTKTKKHISKMRASRKIKTLLITWNRILCIKLNSVSFFFLSPIQVLIVEINCFSQNVQLQSACSNKFVRVEKDRVIANENSEYPRKYTQTAQKHHK